ncbi:MAG: hypothetical protein RLZZ200_1252 [Pseudomonadota bacterium]|jgi:general secretion pathway protein J
MNRTRGFTLVELLVAVFITTILFALGYGAINQAVQNRSTLEASQDRVLAVQKAMRSFVQDFSQLVPRPVRQPLGEGYLPAVQSGSRPELVSFTRGGWTNPAGVQRPALQRVRYRFENGTLHRDYWSALDATLDPQPRSQVLLEDVKSVSLRYMDSSRAWVERWPASEAGSGAPMRELRGRPIAVEITLELNDWGKLVRLIEVPG